MSTESIKYIQQVANYLQIKPSKLFIGDDFMPTLCKENKTIKGFTNIILALISSKQSLDFDRDDLIELHQWLEYSIVYAVHGDVSHNIHQILSELNGVLVSKTYLVGNSLTVADALLYYVIYNLMENLQYLEKEKYINVSRWFDNVQQNPEVRQNNPIVNFNTAYLSGLVPAKH